MNIDIFQNFLSDIDINIFNFLPISINFISGIDILQNSLVNIFSDIDILK